VDFIALMIKLSAHCSPDKNYQLTTHDRGQAGEWLEYPDGVDPFARSKHLLVRAENAAPFSATPFSSIKK
jgi:hypothetical protein